MENSGNEVLINPRYAVFKKLHPEGENWEYMVFIEDMKRKYLGADYKYLDSHIFNHEEFTDFINEHFKCDPKEQK